jgi:hypothetical protein
MFKEHFLVIEIRLLLMSPKMKRNTFNLSELLVFLITSDIVPKDDGEGINFTLESITQIVFNTKSLITITFLVRALFL